jgi:hypothetical protein
LIIQQLLEGRNSGGFHPDRIPSCLDDVLDPAHK